MSEKTYDLGGNWALFVKEQEGQPVECRIARMDERFYSVEMRQIKGYDGPMPIIFEEGGKNPCGQVQIFYYDEKDGRRMVQVKYIQGLMGQELELFASSVSRGGIIPREGELTKEDKCFQANPKRIYGRIEVVTIKVDAAYASCQGVWIDVDEFIKKSEDGRSLAALAKSGLLRR